jgi:two-component system cell cycle response regulator
MAEPSVLLAAEDATLLNAVAWLLKEEGYAVERAAAYDELPRRLEARATDLVLIEVASLDNGVFGMVERLKGDDRWRDLPVLLLAPHDSEEEPVVRLLQAGAADVLRKPVRVRELVARIQVQLRMLVALHAARDARRAAEEDATRARDDADSKRTLVDILSEVTGELSSDEIYRILARRVARALNIARCSVILAQPRDEIGIVAAAYEDPALRNLEIKLDRYPEIRRALDEGVAVLIEDTHTSPVYDEIRKTWAMEGRVVPIRSVIALPFSLDPLRTGVFFLRTDETELALSREDVEFADMVIKAAVAALHRAQVMETTRADKERLETLATTDPLTQLLNRRALVDRLSIEVDRARRYGTVVTLLMIDLDHFKVINDTFGHLAGDDVLREMAALLQGAIRTVDVAARYGGEEFVVILPETGEEGAIAFAERIRERIEEHPFAAAGRALELTASIGVATFPGERVTTTDDLFARADEALYRAKAQGRNRVAS